MNKRLWRASAGALGFFVIFQPMGLLSYEQYKYLVEKERRFFHQFLERNKHSKQPISLWCDDHIERIYNTLCGRYGSQEFDSELRACIQDIIINTAAFGKGIESERVFNIRVAAARNSLRMNNALEVDLARDIEKKFQVESKLGVMPFHLEDAAHQLYLRARILENYKLALKMSYMPPQPTIQLFREIERLFEPLLNYQVLCYLVPELGGKGLSNPLPHDEFTMEDGEAMRQKAKALFSSLDGERNSSTQGYRKDVKKYIDVFRDLFSTIPDSSIMERQSLQQLFVRMFEEKRWQEYIPFLTYFANEKYRRRVDQIIQRNLPRRLSYYRDWLGIDLLAYSVSPRSPAQKLITAIGGKIVGTLKAEQVQPLYDWVIDILNALHLPSYYREFHDENAISPIDNTMVEKLKKRINRSPQA